jgi:hypothetical protein
MMQYVRALLREILAATLLTSLAACDAQIGASNATDGSVVTPADARADARADGAPADAIPDAAPPDAMPCVDGDANVVDPMTGHCYMLFSTIASWEGARLQCEARGAHLMVSTSQAENELVTPLAGIADVWVGGNDIDIEMTWVWITGEPMTYSNWRAGEPNNAGDGEDCMIIEGELGGTWDDRPCDRQYAYLCERE